MATGTLATAARKLQYDVVHTVAKPISYLDGTVTIGTLPAGAAVIGSRIAITTAFAGGTPQTLSIGVAGTTGSYASALVLTTVGVIAGAGMATSTKSYQTADTDVIATLTAGVTPTAGAGYVIVDYVIANRGA